MSPTVDDFELVELSESVLVSAEVTPDVTAEGMLAASVVASDSVIVEVVWFDWCLSDVSVDNDAS